MSADVTFFESQAYFESSEVESDGIPLPTLVLMDSHSEIVNNHEHRPLQVYRRR